MPDLQFKRNGSFTILQFSDLHYRNGEIEDLQTTRLMNQLLNSQPCDLVVLTGDVIDGSFCRDPILSYANAVRPIVERGLPWAAVFGNHDDEGSASRSQLMDAMVKLPGCRASAGMPDLSGVGNYTLAIHTSVPSENLSGGNESSVAANLFFLDSHAYVNGNEQRYDCIHPDQIDWFSRLPHSIPALMFFHIPLQEYDRVWKTGKCIGSKFEPVCAGEKNSGLFDALKKAGDVTGVFVGHDHTNDYIGELDGIQLAYGRSSGFSSYGKEGFPRGARVIRIFEGRRDFWTRVVTDSAQI